MSTERVIVEHSVADEFAAKLAARVAKLPSGDPRQGEVVLGSVVGQATVERVQRLVNAAVSQGATLLTGGGAKGTIMQGIVVDHVRLGHGAVPRGKLRAAGDPSPAWLPWMRRCSWPT